MFLPEYQEMRALSFEDINSSPQIRFRSILVDVLKLEFGLDNDFACTIVSNLNPEFIPSEENLHTIAADAVGNVTGKLWQALSYRGFSKQNFIDIIRRL